MKTQSIKAAVYAAGVVFAPSDDLPNTNAAPHAKSRIKHRRHEASAAYEAKFIDANAKPSPASGWWRALDFSWLFGRATA